MRVALLTQYDPRDPAAFGGRVHLAASSLAGAGLDLVEIGGDDLVQRLHRRLAWEIGRRRHGRRYNVHRDRRLLERYGRRAERLIRDAGVDVVLSLMSPGSQPLAYVGGGWPAVVWTDTTLAGWLDSLPAHERDRLPRRNIADGLANEAAALRRCSLAIFWSDWAAESAIACYGLPAERVRVIPSGPSVACDRDETAVRALVARRPRDVCRLLHVGVGWHRKGADTALAVARELDRRGLPTRITFVGSAPPDGLDRDLAELAEFHGFVSKATPEGRRRIDEAFAHAHFFVLPTRNDCSPLVLNEACSFGVPCLASSIAGVPTLIRDERNGWTLPIDDVGSYADRVQEVFADRDRYEALALSSFREFRERLSWPVASAAVARTLLELVREHG